MSGWISLDRAITKHWLWRDEKFSKGQAWIDLLLAAAHTENKRRIKGTLITVARSEQIRSQVTLATAWSWDRKTVSRFLKTLEKDGMILTKSDHLTSYISICNYDDYQDNKKLSPQLKGQQKGQAAPSREDTNNKGNKGNNDNNINEPFNYFWLNMKLKKAAKPKAEVSFNKVASKQDDKMAFSKMLVDDTKLRSDAGQFGFDRLNPVTYLNQERWEDDKPELAEDFDYVISDFNSAMARHETVPTATLMDHKRITNIKNLITKTNLTAESVGKYFKYASACESVKWQIDHGFDLTWFLSEEAYDKVKGS